MTLKELFPSQNSVEPVSALVFDNRKLEKGCVFIAIRGGRHDGHQFLSEAAERGAIALVVEDSANVPSDFKGHVQKVSSSRAELARLAATWVGHPSRTLFTVGVTGTNGKTTTTNMIESVLTHGGFPTGVIGTIDHHLGKHMWPTEMTTPDPIAFQTRLKEFAALGAKAVALEASSHALDQSRVDAVEFDVGIFTNLTRDHLDYHGTMESYFASKLRLFTDLLANSAKSETRAIINIDDAWGAKAADQLFDLEKKNGSAKPRVWTFAEKPNGSKPARDTKSVAPDFEYEVTSQGFNGVHFSLRSPKGLHKIHLAMAGLHNVQNAIGAFATGLAAGLEVNVALEALHAIRGVSGRLENVPNTKGIHVFVDYAHTDDALDAILRTLADIRRQAKHVGHPDGDARITTVFGCGGDRDKGKRPLMMKAALGGSDAVVVTSDNPRTENPEAIIDDAMMAVGENEKSKVRRVTDRRAAIETAIAAARPGDVVLIAGKGHESTQQIGMTKIAFSDVKVAREILEDT